MDNATWQARACTDLLTSEMRWKAERLSATERARLFVEAGLPLERVLAALEISRATWYRRLAEHDAEQATNAAAGTGRVVGADGVSVSVAGGGVLLCWCGHVDAEHRRTGAASWACEDCHCTEFAAAPASVDGVEVGCCARPVATEEGGRWECASCGTSWPWQAI